MRKKVKIICGTFFGLLVCQLLVLDIYSQSLYNYLWPYNIRSTRDRFGNFNQPPIGTIRNLSTPILPGGCTVSNDIDLYSGTNRVCIPLYTASARGFSLPLSIGYVASGIKLNQISGPIGLGWSLNAGGCIRRITKGLPDDYCGYNNSGSVLSEHGWITPAESYCLITSTAESVASEISDFSPFGAERGCLKHLMGKHTDVSSNCGTDGIIHDLEPDEYVIDCPYIHGAFVFSKERDMLTNLPVIRSIAQSNMKFEYSISSAPADEKIIGFTITDEEGNKFIFGGNVETYTTHQFSVYTNNVPNTGNEPFYLNGNFAFVSSIDRIYDNAWFLQKIVTNLGDEILFTYSKEKYIADPSYVDFIRGETANPPQLNPYKRYMSKYYSSGQEELDCIETYRISNVASRCFSIDFLAFKPRLDINTPFSQFTCKQIDRILIYKKFGPDETEKVLDRQFDFEYSYMFANGNIQTFSPPNCQDFPGANKRLMLNKLTESTSLHAFSPYKFSYIEGQLPNRFCYASDIYGFYNGENSNQTAIPAISVYLADFEYSDRFWPISLEMHQPNYTLPGANRGFNADYAKIGLLADIVYPSGAIVSYVYEPHTFLYKSENMTGAGFRLALKTTADINNVLSKVHYTYEGGKALGFPSFGYFDPTYEYTPNDPDFYWNHSYVRGGVNISNSDGSIGYDKVIVTNNYNGGSTEYEFENTPTLDSPVSQVLPESYFTPGTGSYPDMVSLIPQSSSLTDFTHYAEMDILDPLNPHLLPTIPYPYRNHVNVDWFRGRIKKMTEKDNNDNKVKETEYNYQMRYPGSSAFGNLADQEIIYGIKTGFLDNSSNSSSGPVAVATKYAIYTGVVSLLGSTKTTQYTGNDQIQTQVDYTYNEAGQPETSRTTNSDGTIFQQRSRWLYDFFNPREHSISSNYYAPDGILYYMAYQNQANTMIEQVSEVIRGLETYVTGGTINTFKAVTTINGQVKFLTDKTYVLRTNTLIPADQSIMGHFSCSGISSGQNPVFQFDSRYIPASTFDAYDVVGRLVESHSENDNKNVIIWDGYLDQMQASVINAQRNECEYNGFEYGRNSSHSGYSSAQCVKSTQNNVAFSGNYNLKIGPGGHFQQNLEFVLNKPANNGYIVSAWVKGDDDVIMEMNAMDYDFKLLTKNISNSTPTSEWHLLSLSFTKEEIAQLSYNFIQVAILNNSTSDAYIDEVKCYPADAILTSQSYDEKNNLISSVSKNNLSSSMEYDDVGRTTCVRDFENNILEIKSYNSSNPANFSVCDCDDTGATTVVGKYELNEPLTITSNSFGVPGATFKYAKDSDSFTDCNGQLTLSFSTDGDHTIKMKVTIDGTEHVFLRNVSIF